MNPPNYRPVKKSCSLCKHYGFSFESLRCECEKYDWLVKGDMICDDFEYLFEPNKKLEKAGDE